jgi:transcription factor SPT20
MIVDLLDYRPAKRSEPPSKEPEKTRTVLHPNGETLWADICLINRNLGGTMTDDDCLMLESKMLVCLLSRSTSRYFVLIHCDL